MDFEAFVPSSDTLRELAGTGDVERFILLGVSGKAFVRASWSQDAEVTPSLFQALKNSERPKPDLNSDEEISHRELDPRSLTARIGRCSTCAFTPGRVFCSICGGTGALTPADENGSGQPCTACKDGKLVCPTCDGKAQAMKVKVIYSRDQPQVFARAFVPEAVDMLREPLIEFLKAQPEVPECLKIDLGDEFASGDAYRGRRAAFEYRDHQLGGTLTLARRYVERLNALPSVVACRHFACAWPFAVANERGRQLVMLDSSGAPRLVATAPA